MLLALVEELGHEYEPLLTAAPSTSSKDSELLLELATNQTKARRNSLSDEFFCSGSSGETGANADTDTDDSD